MHTITSLHAHTSHAHTHSQSLCLSVCDCIFVILLVNSSCIFVQVKVRLRKALERNSVLEDELMLANQEVCAMHSVVFNPSTLVIYHSVCTLVQ